jgi:hypothetical protein
MLAVLTPASFVIDRFKSFFDNNFTVSRYVSEQQQQQRGGGADVSFLQTAVTQLDELVKEQVSLHKRSLLGQARNILSLETVLGNVRQQVNHLHSSVTQLHHHIQEPLTMLSQRQGQLERMQRTSQLLRQVQRCMYLISRVRAQLASGNELVQAAAALAELHQLYSEKGELDISGIHVVDRELPFVQSAKSLLESRASALVSSLAQQSPQPSVTLSTANSPILPGAASGSSDSSGGGPLTLAPIPSLHTALMVLYNLGCLKRTIMSTLDRWNSERDSALQAVLQVPSSAIPEDGYPVSRAKLQSAANSVWSNVEKLLAREGSALAIHVTRMVKLSRTLNKLAKARAPPSFTPVQDSHKDGSNGSLHEETDELISVSSHVSQLQERLWLDFTRALNEAVERAITAPTTSTSNLRGLASPSTSTTSTGEILTDILGTLQYPKLLLTIHDFVERMESQHQLQLAHPSSGVGHVARLEDAFLKGLANKFSAVTKAIFSTGGDPSSPSASAATGTSGGASPSPSPSSSPSPLSVTSALVSALGGSGSTTANGASSSATDTSVPVGSLGSLGWLSSSSGSPLVTALFGIPGGQQQPQTSPGPLPTFGELLPGALPHLFELMELIRVHFTSKLAYQRVNSHCHLLPKSIRSIGKAIKLFHIKCEEMIATDPDAYSLPDISGAALTASTIGNGSGGAAGTSTQSLTPSQRRNVRVFNSVVLLGLALTRLVKDPLSAAISALGRSSGPTTPLSAPSPTYWAHRDANLASLRSALDVLLSAYVEPLDRLGDQIIDPLFLRFNKMLERTITTIHSTQYEWYHAPTTPAASPSSPGTSRSSSLSLGSPATPTLGSSAPPTMDLASESSKYVRVLSRQVNLFIFHLLRAFSPIASRIEERSRQAASRAIKLFVRCVVLLPPPLAETSKLRLAADMAQLEYALSPLCRLSEATIGDAYRELRTLRPIIFLETEKLGTSREASGLPAAVLIHHLISRSPDREGLIQQPYAIKGWSLKQYLDWLEHATDESALQFVRTVLNSVWQQHTSASDEKGAFMELFKTVFESIAKQKNVQLKSPSANGDTTPKK